MKAGTEIKLRRLAETHRNDDEPVDGDDCSMLDLKVGDIRDVLHEIDEIEKSRETHPFDENAADKLISEHIRWPPTLTMIRELRDAIMDVMLKCNDAEIRNDFHQRRMYDYRCVAAEYIAKLNTAKDEAEKFQKALTLLVLEAGDLVSLVDGEACNRLMECVKKAAAVLPQLPLAEAVLLEETFGKKP